VPQHRASEELPAKPPVVATRPPDQIEQALSRLDCPAAGMQVPPLCRPLTELRQVGVAAEGSLRLSLAGGKPGLVEGDPIKVEVRAPPYPVNLRIDYFTLDGQVLHLWPNRAEPTARLAAGAARVFEKGPNGVPWEAGGAPFGTELITAIATPTPIDLGSSRPPVEPAAAYLQDLARGLARITAAPATPSAAAPLLVKTSGKP
jgi:hypothetical protein